jgi:hypothetical protein
MFIETVWYIFFQGTYNPLASMDPLVFVSLGPTVLDDLHFPLARYYSVLGGSGLFGK